MADSVYFQGMANTPPNPYSDLPPSQGLPAGMEPRTLDWNTVKHKSLKALIQLSPEYGKKAGIPYGATDPSFEGVVNAVGVRPLNTLNAEDLVALTSGLLHNIKNQPGAHDWEYIHLIRHAWKHHGNEADTGVRTLKASKSELTDLANNITAIVPHKHDMEERLPQPLEMDERYALKTLRNQLEDLAAKIHDPESKEDTILQWVQSELKGINIKQGFDGKHNKICYSIDLLQPKRAINSSAIVNFFAANGGMIEAVRQRIKVIPDENSPLANVLSVVTRSNIRNR